VTHDDAVRARFAATAERAAAHAERHVEELREPLRAFLAPTGRERVVDAGCGAGALALALAPLVREVVGVDLVPELLEVARRNAPANATFVEGDATQLPFELGEFDLACTRGTVHHIARPELAIAELTRVTRRLGQVLVIDQIAPADPLAALELDRFERARDPSHTRTLPDVDFRHLFEANGLVVLRAEYESQHRPLEDYFDLAGCEGDDREHARALSPGGPEHYPAEIAWYLLRRP
jgi:SAM-dependent methyltransferase